MNRAIDHDVSAGVSMIAAIFDKSHDMIDPTLSNIVRPAPNTVVNQTMSVVPEYIVNARLHAMPVAAPTAKGVALLPAIQLNKSLHLAGSISPSDRARFDPPKAPAPTHNLHNDPLPAVSGNPMTSDGMGTTAQAVAPTDLVSQQLGANEQSATATARTPINHHFNISRSVDSQAGAPQAHDLHLAKNPGDAAGQSGAPTSGSGPSAMWLPAIDPARQSPAAARAAQIDAAIRLENSTHVPSDLTLRSLPIPAGGQSSTPIQIPISGPNVALFMPPTIAPDSAQNHPRFNAQLVRGLYALVNHRGGTITMRLDAPDLGDLRIEMTLSRGNVHASFHPSSVQAHSLLERGMAALHSTLESHGLAVERLVVHAPQNAAATSWNEDRPNDGAPAERHQHDASHGRSRGRQEHGSHHMPMSANQLLDDAGTFPGITSSRNDLDELDGRSIRLANENVSRPSTRSRST